jgi:Matrixin
MSAKGRNESTGKKKPAVEYRAVCRKGDYTGDWRSDAQTAKDDGTGHRAEAGMGHRSNIDVRQHGAGPFALRQPAEGGRNVQQQVHVFGNRVVCDTESRGFATPRGRSPLKIVVDASEGFIPLWAKGTILRWRFREQSLKLFKSPPSAKDAVRKLLGDAILAWGDAAPVKFAERDDAWDFEVVVRKADDCDISGCVLASAFFPDPGRHKLVLFPKLFVQSKQEQVETLVHEIGHVLGLRHFFANVSETAWPSQVFGKHQPFSIMNYGSQSVLTVDDKADLKRLYQLTWNGELTQINGTPIRLVKPFHTIGESNEV